ncbi:hypothetical protein ACGFRB_29035 [Streptomyces sp. NPDC048718]|uniref:hypothetical protein n=1 Tax=Streptomyces sp. NPDC048718 TaxID=3365587 RepID=UPI00371EEB3F
MPVRLVYEALCDANKHWYVRYAEIWTSDRTEARRCVQTALDALEAQWATVLRTASPAARVWKGLRAEVERRSAAEGSTAEHIRSLLSGDQADILLLHQKLRLPLKQAARLMGLPEPEALVLLRGAERRLAADGR